MIHQKQLENVVSFK